MTFNSRMFSGCFIKLQTFQTFFSFSGKFKRVAEQFTPYSWTSYDWKATTSLKRWLAVCGIAAVVCYVLSLLVQLVLPPLKALASSFDSTEKAPR